MTLIACHECDLLHRKVALSPGAVARCGRCGCTLYRHHPGRTDHYLALVVGALIVLVIANAFPIITLELQGYRHGSTLIGAVRALFAAEMDVVAMLVLLTAIVFPLAELLLLLVVLLALQTGRAGPDQHRWLRWLQRIRPWVMMDVFLMAVLVALSKLAHTASVIPGVSLWAFAVLA
ncbi:MAG: paraquat-inducible protein A, partial [Perlucidibaca sp.]